MTRRRRILLPLALVLLAVPGTTVAAPSGSRPAPPPGVSLLAYRHVVGATRPELVLAQRTIDREWGPSDDSVYVEVDLPNWKSEPLATSLSAALPGAGQLYVGNRNGWVFAAIEAAGWGGWWWFRHDGRRLRRDAAGLAGAPEENASGWSYQRWTLATEGDATYIAALYSADREAFYQAIVEDPRYQAGWESEETRARVDALRSRSDLRLGRARAVIAGVWLNHLVAAVGALRAARFHNLPITEDLGLRVDAGLERGRASISLALERKL